MNAFSPEIPVERLHEIRAACAYLFTPQQARDDSFLSALDQESVRRAFRSKARRYHPDLHREESGPMAAKRAERFVKVRQAYELMVSCLPQAAPSRRKALPRIIAVGGAKGGIGKSLLAANLGICLARTGEKVVVADLDLGGANLHLYLGETRMRQSINDFLSRQAPTLESIMTKTQYGPWLIGGDSSRLGAANIGFATKVRLIKALRSLDADHVILDLGGDTSFNIMDFFLAADLGLVLTTCDPASYLEAYNFIKVGLHRKLNRMFGDENPNPAKRHAGVEELIRQAAMPSNGQKTATIAGLLDRMDSEQPNHAALVREVIASYRPRLVINRECDPSRLQDVAGRITGVAKKMLSIDVQTAGSLPHEAEVELSARTLVPVLHKNPGGLYGARIKALMEGMAG